MVPALLLMLTILIPMSVLRAQQSDLSLDGDLDGDGVVDVLDLDQDNDGIINSLEGVHLFEDLSGLDAEYFAAVPAEEISRRLSRDYDLISTENGQRALLVGRVLSTDTGVEWTMYDALPRLRNLGSGSTIVQWSVTGERQFDDIDMTISDLDGARNETVTVSASSIVGYSVSLNTNIVVNHSNGQVSFTGTGAGGDSTDDLVTLHFRKSPLMVVSYKNGAQPTRGELTDSSENSEVDIAGYRHSLDRTSSTFYTPVTQVRDTDGDGVSDHRDLDSDNDGLGDVVEAGGIDADHNNLIDGLVDLQGLSASADPGLDAAALAAVYFASDLVTGTDLDRDGLLSSVDGSPSEFGGSLAGRDTDSDGLSDLDEVRIFQTNPNEPDSDGDGLDDQSEVENFLTDPLLADTDGDDLIDGDEINVLGTDPIRVDSDADGIADGKEIERGTDPLQSEPAVVGEPQPVVQLEPVVGPGEDATPIVNTTDTDAVANEDVASEDAIIVQSDSDAPILDDPSQIDTSSLRTGVSGTPGCSGAYGTPAPLMLMMLLMAFMCLQRKRRSNV